MKNLLIAVILIVISCQNLSAAKVTVTKLGDGEGYVHSAASHEPGIKCDFSSICSHDFLDNSQVRFLVNGDPYVWGGDCNANGVIQNAGTDDSTCTIRFTKTTMPNVSFSNANWTTNSGASISGDTLTMHANPNGIVRADLEIDATPDMLGKNIYLIGDVFMDDIKSPSNYILSPSFALTDISGGTSKNYKSYSLLDGTTTNWVPTGVGNRFTSATTRIKATIMLHRVSSGRLRVRNLRLTRTPLKDTSDYPFNVPNNVNCKLTIDTNNIKPVNADLLGFNQYFGERDIHPLNYDNKPVQDLIHSLDMSLLRFPGGTHANWYDWRTDNLINPMPTDLEMNAGFKKHYKDRVDHSKTFKFGSYARLLISNNISTSLIFNILENTPSESVARLNDRIGKFPALAIKYIEIGNENYFTDQQSGNINATDQSVAVQQYIRHSKAHIEALKAVNDDIMYSVNVHGPTKPWAIAMSNAMKEDDYFDAIVPHLYVNWPFNPAFLDFNTAKKALTSYSFAKEKLEGWKRLFPNKPMVISEWGSMDRASGEMMGNPLGALSNADMFFAMMDEEEHIVAAMQHVFFSSFMGAYRDVSPNNTIVKTPNAFQYEFIKEVLQGNQLLGTTYQSTLMAPNAPFIRALAAKDSQGTIKVFVINKAPIAANFNIEIAGVAYRGNYKIKSYSEPDIYMPKVYDFSDDIIQSKTGTGQIKLAPYSMSVVEISSATVTHVRADVDANSNVNYTDAMLTLRNSVGLAMRGTDWKDSITTGDVNCDGASNSVDAMLILRDVRGLEMSGTGWCVRSSF